MKGVPASQLVGAKTAFLIAPHGRRSLSHFLLFKRYARARKRNNRNRLRQAATLRHSGLLRLTVNQRDATESPLWLSVLAEVALCVAAFS